MPSSSSDLEFQDWGLIDYAEALKKQEELAALVADKQTPGYLIFCTHPPIVTLGRKTQEGDVFSWQGEVLEISRGGRATYHGPSQLVVYPIFNLAYPRAGKPEKDIGWYLRSFENAIVATLAEYQVKAEGKKTEDATGVWVGPQKIASLGIAIRKWVSFHGAAINLDHDPKAFQGLNPCGFESSIMVSLEKLTAQKINRDLFKSKLCQNLQNEFGKSS